MQLVKESEREYRFGDSGPKYLRKGPRLSAGVVLLQPGQDFKNHYHDIMEESFFVLEGKLDIKINDTVYHCEPGDLITAEPGETHYLQNNGTEPMKAVFMLGPFQKMDKVEVDD